ncbi:MAG: hypothetical protein D6805_05955 [Planctomycetota bacterium]|nr:MAG: hypothetical protein D6805_05955 [Planctomycetota bacterium]
MPREIHFKIDGKEVIAKEGETVIQVAHREGIQIPHFCYHPGLPIDGNCRMCIAKFAAPRGDKIVPFPKPMTTCTTYPTEGMEVDTTSQEVQEMRRGIMEFLLINHPLDCPVCDQAGECTLQDYAYTYGRDKGRFQEEKVHKHTKNMGKYVALWGERCIVCTRCVRFLDHISGTSEIGVVHRGDHAVVDIFEGHPLDNPLSMNVIDICPVGALVSRDFLFKQRVWFMQSAKTICTACSKGCNIFVDYDQHKLYRIRSRPNLDVNQWWICDYGRMYYKHVQREDRLKEFYERQEDQLQPKPNREVIQNAIEHLKNNSQQTAFLASLHLTLEAMYLTYKLAQHLEISHIGALQNPILDDEVFPGFTIEGDKNPNRKGFQLIFGQDALENGLSKILELIQKQKIQTLLLISCIPDFQPPEELLHALKTLNKLILIDISQSPFLDYAHWALAGSTYTEEDGCFINSRGNYQIAQMALPTPGTAEQTHAILQRLIFAWKGETKEPISQRGVRKAMFKELPELSQLKEEKSYPHLSNNPQGTKAVGLYW